MTKSRAIRIMLISAAIIFTAMLLLTGCKSKMDIDTSGMYLVVYDGNGGYLGNKTSMMRKLYCQPGSKIPDYPVDYTLNQYTVSSLGLAMRNGYQLLGWYSNADYSENDNGDYILLSLDDGNGVYTANINGEYVHKYIASEDGEFIYVFVEEPDTENEGDEPVVNENTYVFINSTPDEESTPLSVESGFYICNGDEDINSIDDDDLRAAYKNAYETKTYTISQLNPISGWQIFDDLPEDFKELLTGIDKYSFSFGKAEDEDADLDHYELVSDYASVYNIFVENSNGLFVQSGKNFVKYDENNPDHAKLTRFSVNDNYVFTGDGTTSMKRFDAAMKYWDFANDRVTEDVCTWDGEKYVLTLYAHWVKKNTVFYHYNNGTGQIDESTRKLLADNITYQDIVPGDTIGRKEIIPTYPEHTFLGWSTSETEYKPWNFATDLFPENSTELHLYAYFIDGIYTRVDSSSKLAKIGEDPAGKYLLTADIDFDGAKTNDPLGLNGQVFTGELISTGFCIKNFTMILEGKKTQSENDLVGVSLIPEANGAKIDGIKVECSVICSAADRKVKSPMHFFCSSLIGKASGNKSEVKDCSFDLKVASLNATTLANPVAIYFFNISDICAENPDNVKVTGCSSSIDTEGLVGGVEITKIQLAK